MADHAELHRRLEEFIEAIANRVGHHGSALKTTKKEAAMLLMLLLDIRSLSRNDALFVETLQGKRRKPIVEDPRRRTRLSLGQKTISILFWVILPYMQSKVDIIATSNNNLQQLRAKILKFYPYWYTSTKGVNFGYQMLHMFKLIQYPSPILHITKFQISSTTTKDMLKLSSQTCAQLKDTMKSPKNYSLQSIYSKIFHRALDFIQFGVLVDQFTTSWSRWCYGDIQKKKKFFLHKQTTRFVLPPPPRSSCEIQGDKSVCPTCHTNKKKEALCILCGYLVCQQCVDEKKNCILTSKPMERKNIRILKQLQH